MKKSIEGVRVIRAHNRGCQAAVTPVSLAQAERQTGVAPIKATATTFGRSWSMCKWVDFECTNVAGCPGRVRVREDVLAQFVADLMVKALEARKK